MDLPLVALRPDFKVWKHVISAWLAEFAPQQIRTISSPDRLLKAMETMPGPARTERPMKTNFVRSCTAGDEPAGAKFFNWAIIVVAAGLLVAATSEFSPKQSEQASVARAPATTTVVQAATPPKT
jgi:hypothetical protein